MADFGHDGGKHAPDGDPGPTRSRRIREKAMKALTAALLVCSTITASVCGAGAADWPTRPVKIVVPFGAGGQSDIVARLLAQSLSEHFKQQFYVENVSGGGGASASKL